LKERESTNIRYSRKKIIAAKNTTTKDTKVDTEFDKLLKPV